MKNQISREKLTGYKSGYESDVDGSKLNGNKGLQPLLAV